MTTPSYHEIESRLKTLEELLERNAQLTVADRYYSSIMHEVNNPLEAMVNLVFLLQHEEPLPPGAAGRVRELEEQLRVLTHVARQSLSYSRDQEIPKAVDLVQVAESALKLHTPKIRERKINVAKRFRTVAVCHGISGELLQVLSNLILNSLDALDSQAGATLHIRVHRGSGGVHVTVADNGSGVPKHVETSLFSQNVTTKQHGTGLGLWLSSRILKRHEGKIRMRTCRQPGKSGTVFRITLPHAKAA